MKNKIKSKLILFAIFLSGVGVTCVYFGLIPQRNDVKIANILPDSLFGWKYPVAKFPSTGPGAQLAYSDIRDPGGLPQGLPVRLKVPIIAVDTAIEDALITPDGRMDVPAGSVNVAWFSLGPHPGQTGSAVIGGHYGISNGKPFVFYNLDKLKIGDKIYIIDDKNATLAFVVRAIKSFDRNADATAVFTSSDGLAHLNLITCEGVWNRVNDTYPQRLVIFTDAIPAEGAVPASRAPAKAAPRRTLAMGTRGAEVTALQTALVKKGFLAMPRGVAYGFFGVLTRAALAKYQTNVDLPASGIFNQATRAKFTPEEIAVKPALPVTALNEPAATAMPITQALARSAKSLFATAMDGLITTLLLLAIIYLIYKIIRR